MEEVVEAAVVEQRDGGVDGLDEAVLVAVYQFTRLKYQNQINLLDGICYLGNHVFHLIGSLFSLSQSRLRTRWSPRRWG